MMIPKSFKVGPLRYKVELRQYLPLGCMGHVYYAHGVIRITTHVGTRKRKSTAVAETFWHETTHAILHDMGSPLAENEAFVTDFSRRLNQVVRTAKL